MSHTYHLYHADGTKDSLVYNRPMKYTEMVELLGNDAYIEEITTRDGLVYLVDEDGIAKRLPRNMNPDLVTPVLSIRTADGYLRGNVIVGRHGEDGEFVGI